uniref:Uncharacterized protein n=1 Tax=Ditylenchus dipsaci TaxID=166011 RepID=A0A915EQL5_9BILA
MVFQIDQKWAKITDSLKSCVNNHVCCATSAPRSLIYVVLCVLAVILIFQLGANLSPRLVVPPRPPPAGSSHERDFYLRREAARVPAVEARAIPPDDEHTLLLDNNEENGKAMRLRGANIKKKTIYPPRVNMGACPNIFGTIVVFVAVVESSYKTHYHVAQQSLELCKHDQLFFKKHCAASVYLQDADWMLVLDADAGVVNPNHCIEEWIDDRVDLVFYERFFNWEIASGNYLAKNTEFARNFLMKWADWQYIQPSNWNGADNGVLQCVYLHIWFPGQISVSLHILQTVLPDARAEIKACDTIWHKGTGYDTYMAYVACVKVTLGANRLYPGVLRILRRAHGWVRDGYITNDAWGERDFMLHGWKAQQINTDGWTSPYSRMFNVSECGVAYSGWYWRNEKRLGTEAIRIQLANFERSVANTFPKEARIHPYLSEPDVGDCFPNCDDLT